MSKNNNIIVISKKKKNKNMNMNQKQKEEEEEEENISKYNIYYGYVHTATEITSFSSLLCFGLTCVFFDFMYKKKAIIIKYITSNQKYVNKQILKKEKDVR